MDLQSITVSPPERMSGPNETPTAEQIEAAQLLGWAYHGDGVFSRGDDLGWYTVDGSFYKA